MYGDCCVVLHHGAMGLSAVFIVYFFLFSGFRILSVYQMPHQHIICDIVRSYIGVPRLRSTGKQLTYQYSVCIKCLISIPSVILLGLILAYHALEVQVRHLLINTQCVSNASSAYHL